MKILSTSLEKMAIQKELLLQSNKALVQALEDERYKVIKLMSMLSEENAEKFILTQKLEAANNKTTMSDLVKSTILPEFIIGSV